MPPSTSPPDSSVEVGGLNLWDALDLEGALVRGEASLLVVLLHGHFLNLLKLIKLLLFLLSLLLSLPGFIFLLLLLALVDFFNSSNIV